MSTGKFTIGEKIKVAHAKSELVAIAPSSDFVQPLLSSSLTIYELT